jgi:hypothetical protein
MVSVPRVVQGLIIFSAVLGVPFLVQVYPRLPAIGFDFVAAGWILFVVASALTFVKPKAAFYLAFILAVVALAASLGEPAHYGFLESGDILASATIILGDAAEVLLIVLVPYLMYTQRGKDEWAWPGAKSQA